jgi:hypothetical protein
MIFTDKINDSLHVHNFALLQWLVVDGTAQCNLITIAGQTRQTSSDKSATASNADRYMQPIERTNFDK